jgi:hypothetical protein
VERASASSLAQAVANGELGETRPVYERGGVGQTGQIHGCDGEGSRRRRRRRASLSTVTGVRRTCTRELKRDSRQRRGSERPAEGKRRAGLAKGHDAQRHG